jgi:predicted nucleic acid-binding Zn ribbon protein
MTPELRAKVLSEWRGYPQRAIPADRTRSVADTLGAVMRQLGIEERLTESQILAAWREIVGEWFALHTHPDRLREGVLYVRVVQSSIHCELDRNCKAQIVQKLKARFGAKRVRDLKFRVG